MSTQLQPIKQPQKVTLQLHEGVKACFITGNIKEIERILSERQTMGAPPITPPPTEIHDREFEDCKCLIDIEINDLYIRIGEKAFCNCSNLKSVRIGKNMEIIALGAFEGCGKLNKIQFNGTIEQWKAITKNIFWNRDTGNYTVYCMDGKLDKNDNTRYPSKSRE